MKKPPRHSKKPSERMHKFVVLPDGRLDKSPYADAMPDSEFSPLVLPTVSTDLDVQFRYARMRFSGESHNMAEMLATRTFPGVKTDAVFNNGKFSGDSGKIGPQQLWLKQQAEAAGVSTNGKWYCSGLADFPGDPTAWIDSRNDVLRIAETKNMTVHGYVEHQGRQVAPVEDVEIADDLVRSEVEDIVESNPGINESDVWDQVYQTRTGKIDNNPLLCEDHFTTDIP